MVILSDYMRKCQSKNFIILYEDTKSSLLIPPYHFLVEWGGGTMALLLLLDVAGFAVAATLSISLAILVVRHSNDLIYHCVYALNSGFTIYL